MCLHDVGAWDTLAVRHLGRRGRAWTKIGSLGNRSAHEGTEQYGKHASSSQTTRSQTYGQMFDVLTNWSRSLTGSLAVSVFYVFSSQYPVM